MIKLVAFSGYARTGKDTAQSLLDEFGWQRVAFAEPMREFLYKLNPLIEPNSDIRLAPVIDVVGWNGYKETAYGQEIRALMQRLGTECGRQIIGENVWVDAALDNLKDGKYAVTDCRFVNEADAVRARGGKVIRIERPGVGPANEHISETGLDDYDFDYVIHNDGSLDEFKAKLLSRIGY